MTTPAGVNTPHQPRIALLTGGATGIGLATARRLLQAGMTVAVLDVNPEVHGILADHEDLLPWLSTHRVDLRSDEDTRAAVGAVLASQGKVDVLVNNAGIHPRNGHRKYLTEELTRAGWDEVLQVNLTAPFLLAQLVLPGMKESGWGRIVNIASGGAFGRPVGTSAAYVASKAALIGLTHCLAEESARYGVTANSIAPGPIKTELSMGASAEVIAKVSESTSLGRYGEPDDIAAAVEFLCSDDASFITGTVMNVDGGSTMC
jgi:3-oxoacyl-[acyl-carrier protein] reductase